MKVKRWLAIILSLVMVFSLSAPAAQAATTEVTISGNPAIASCVVGNTVNTIATVKIDGATPTADQKAAWTWEAGDPSIVEMAADGKSWTYIGAGTT